MRADSRTGRIIGALARAPIPPPAPSNFGVPGESFVGRAISALARAPEVIPADFGVADKGTARREGPIGNKTDVQGSPSLSPPASTKHMPSGPADTAKTGIPRVQPDDAPQIIEMRLIARDLIRALGKVFEIAYALGGLTGIVFDIEPVAAAAKSLAQALSAVVALLKALDRIGAAGLTRAFGKETDLSLVNALAIARTLRNSNIRVDELTRIVNGIRLPRAPIDANEWDLTRVLQRLSPVPDDVAELTNSVDSRNFSDSGLSSIDRIENVLSSGSGQLREVARSAVNLANELDRANVIARQLESAQQELADVPANLLEFADQLAREFNSHELSRAYTMAQAMSELLNTLDGIRESASIIARASDVNEALNARILVSQLDNLEMTFNFARTKNIKRRTVDNVGRALEQIVRLAVTPIDASSADLRHLSFGDLSELEGILWTPDTKWPARSADEIRARSDEIRPRVYRVRGGNERDPLELVVGV
jgi:hypothetical protein